MEKNTEKVNPLEAMPPELWQNILEYCCVGDLVNLRFVNRLFKSVAADLLRRNLGQFHSDLESHIDSRCINSVISSLIT